VNRDQDTCLNSAKQGFDPCGDASDHAQDVNAVSDAVKNLLTFFSAGLLGELSDVRGRKPVLIMAFIIQSLPNLAYFVILFYLHRIQDMPSPSPAQFSTLAALPYIYYLLNAVTGLVNFLTLVITCTADVLPAGPGRAVAVGIILAIFFAGVSMAPLVVNSLITSDVATAGLSYLIVGVVVPVYAAVGLKESLTPAAAFQAKLQKEQRQEGEVVKLTLLQTHPHQIPHFIN
jgi:MFS family permease